MLISELLSYVALHSLIAYLIGSIPFGYLVGRLSGIGDIRKVGSGNIGATNMVRAGGKKLGALVLLLDAAKGGIGFTLSAMAVTWEPFQITTLTGAFPTDPNSRYMIPATAVEWLGVLVLLSVFIGHMFPLWLKFRGGKGISIMIGTLACLPFLDFQLAYGWLPLVVYLALWLLLYKITHVSSIAGLTATLGVVLALAVLSKTSGGAYQLITLTYLVAAVLVVARHKSNIVRLLNGQEQAFRKKERP